MPVIARDDAFTRIVTFQTRRDQQGALIGAGEPDGTRFAWRSHGRARPGEPPLVLLHRFRAAMGDWNPLLLDLLARERRVIAFDNRGAGESAGETPPTLERAADDAAAFLRALGIGQADVLGWSMGGMTAPILALRHPGLVRRLVLCGTLPAGGSPEVVPSGPEWSRRAGKPAYEDEDILRLFDMFGRIATDLPYAGQGAIAFLIDAGGVAGFREYVGGGARLDPGAKPGPLPGPGGE